MFEWTKEWTREATDKDLASALYKLLDNRLSAKRRRSIEMSSPEARALFRYQTQRRKANT
jgi:hypothetical protein